MKSSFAPFVILVALPCSGHAATITGGDYGGCEPDTRERQNPST